MPRIRAARAAPRCRALLRYAIVDATLDADTPTMRHVAAALLIGYAPPAAFRLLDIDAAEVDVCLRLPPCLPRLIRCCRHLRQPLLLRRLLLPSLMPMRCLMPLRHATPCRYCLRCFAADALPMPLMPSCQPLIDAGFILLIRYDMSAIYCHDAIHLITN